MEHLAWELELAFQNHMFCFNSVRDSVLQINLLSMSNTSFTTRERFQLNFWAAAPFIFVFLPAGGAVHQENTLYGVMRKV